jgi:hypothetical protein
MESRSSAASDQKFAANPAELPPAPITQPSPGWIATDAGSSTSNLSIFSQIPPQGTPYDAIRAIARRVAALVCIEGMPYGQTHSRRKQTNSVRDNVVKNRIITFVQSEVCIVPDREWALGPEGSK